VLTGVESLLVNIELGLETALLHLPDNLVLLAPLLPLFLALLVQLGLRYDGAARPLTTHLTIRTALSAHSSHTAAVGNCIHTSLCKYGLTLISSQIFVYIFKRVRRFVVFMRKSLILFILRGNYLLRFI